MPDQPADEFRLIPLDQIVEPWVVLRVVNRESIEYLELRDSIAQAGPPQFHLCAAVACGGRASTRWWTASIGTRRACELRLPAMPCIVKHNLTDEDVLAIQIQANALRPETTAMEYARQIRRIMDAITARQGRDATLADVSNLIHKNPEWIGRQLGCSACGRTSRRPWSAARYRLARPTCSPSCRASTRRSFWSWRRRPRRGSSPRGGPAGQADSRGGPPREAARLLQGFRAGAPLAVLEGSARRVPRAPSWRLGRGEGRQCKTPVDGWYLALQWALNLDEESIRQQREKFVARTRASLLERRVEPCDDNE